MAIALNCYYHVMSASLRFCLHVCWHFGQINQPGPSTLAHHHRRTRERGERSCALEIVMFACTEANLELISCEGIFLGGIAVSDSFSLARAEFAPNTHLTHFFAEWQTGELTYLRRADT